MVGVFGALLEEYGAFPQNDPRLRYHLDKAHADLRTMKLLFQNEIFEWTIVCGYHAMRHAVLAALCKAGVQANSGHCALEVFKECYVVPEKISKEYVAYVKHAKQLKERYLGSCSRINALRISECYGVGVLISDDAEWIVEDAPNVVSKIEELIII